MPIFIKFANSNKADLRSMAEGQSLVPPVMLLMPTELIIASLQRPDYVLSMQNSLLHNVECFLVCGNEAIHEWLCAINESS